MEAKLLTSFGQGQPSGGGFYLQAGQHIARCTFQPIQQWSGFGAAKRLKTYPAGAIRVPFCDTFRDVDSLDSAKAYLVETVERSGRTIESERAPDNLIIHGHESLSCINPTQRLYVMKSGDGFSCYGFDVLERKAAAVAEWLLADSDAAEMATAPEKGTPAAFDLWQTLARQAAAYSAATGRRCEAELVPELIGLEGKRVEVESSDGEKRRFIVGRSTGWLPCHLEIARRNSNGGGCVYWPEGTRLVRVLEGGR